MRVLVVHNLSESRRALAQALSSAGYVVETTASGDTALDKLSQSHWDVVVTDLRLPTMSDLELLRQVTAKHPSVAVFIATAQATIEQAVGVMQLGAEDVLTEPWSASSFEARLDELARRRCSSAGIRCAS